MTVIGLLGIIFSILAFGFARAGESRSRLILFVLLLGAHVGASIAYYMYAKEFGGDVGMYYYDPFGIYGRGSGLSTVFVVNFTQFLKEYIGGSFLDYFFLYQAMGFWGIIFVLRTFDDIHDELGQRRFSYVYLLLFLPGIHFWTSAIGKDAPLFLGVAMCVWAVVRLLTRWPAFAAGLVITLLFRPHIALIALVALALTVLVGRNTKLITRFALLAVAVAGIGSVGGLVSSSFNGLNLTNTDAVTEFIETKSTVSEESGGDMSIINASFPVKLVSLLFRPFFVDATGLLGYIASVENVVLLILILTLIRRMGTAYSIAQGALFARFAFLFFVMLTLLLAWVNYNVGLGLRQKMMMMPALLVFFAALLAVRAARKQQTVYAPGAAAYAGAPPGIQGYGGA
ncbi:MAG TPA: hypothetical protein VFR28_04990 [Allosphingosinicella sp.]|nr:hypothetical protein [Allosphingosinicella sp.]